MIAVLTEAGHVLVEWPFDGEFHEQIVQHHDAMSRRGSRLSTGDGVLHCATWEIHKDFLELPPLPNNLPALDPPVAAYADGEEELRIVKIAAGEGFVVVLTNQGHVLKMDITHTESLDELRQNFKNGRKTWIYVRNLGYFHASTPFDHIVPISFQNSANVSVSRQVLKRTALSRQMPYI